jgi:lipopolysaccharide transport system ATP-binding protein
MKPILEVRNLGKKYQIRHQIGGYLSLRERLVNAVKLEKNTVEDFWALNDISFDINHGESVGIIGRNGAGKSTLLKVLSKITPPSTGHIISRGRVASLLEVGTGFHPELTGRENIFFNGSLLGMRRREIESKFDEIVDFSGVEKFLDTPLKNFSSGMQLRLAFAVAAFLEPEILIIDEVLAVGDAEFQKKCIGKMEDVSKSGRTILFVSHNMSAVQSLCAKSMLLNQGKILSSGPTQKVIDDYQNLLEATINKHTGTVIPTKKNENGPVKRVEIFCDGRLSPSVYMGCNLEIKVHFETQNTLDYPVLGLLFRDMQNSPLLCINNRHYLGLKEVVVKKGSISMNVPFLTLFEGIYFVDVYFGNGFRDIEVLPECFQLNVDPLKFSNLGELPDRKYNKFFIKDVIWNIASAN